MRLLMITTTFPGELGDGTPEFVFTLARSLPGIDVTIVAPRIRGGVLHESVGNVRIIRAPYAPRRFENLADDAIVPTLRAHPIKFLQVPSLVISLAVTSLVTAIKHRSQVIHGHWVLPGGFLAMLVAKLLRRPYIVTAHGADIHTLTGKQAIQAMKLVLRNSSANYPVSNEIQELLNQLEPGAAAQITPMGVDYNRFESIRAQRAPTSQSLLFVGRLADKKGVDILLQALAQAEVEATLTVVGDGPDRSTLEQMVSELGLSNAVTFLGNQTQEQVFEHYRTSSVLVIPSRVAKNNDKDGTPVVLMEAMTCGIPVIVAGLAGLAEQVDHQSTGLVFPPGDVDVLARLIEDLLGDSDLAEQLSAAAKLHSQGHLDAAIIGRRMADDIRRLVTEN